MESFWPFIMTSTLTLMRAKSTSLTPFLHGEVGLSVLRISSPFLSWSPWKLSDMPKENFLKETKNAKAEN